MKPKKILILDNPMSRSPRAAYIHVPFCRKKCGYCDFYSFQADDSQIAVYVRALISEIRYMSSLSVLFPSRERLDSVYFGGGTPSLLTAEQVSDILQALDANLGLSDRCEISLEANPDSSSAQRFLDYRAAGVNRLSLGLQSLNDSLLRRLERLHDSESAKAAIQKAKRSGFRRLSVDLMIGLPGQILDHLAVDLEFLLAEEIPHFSLYSLSIEKNTPFFERYFQESQAGEAAPPFSKGDFTASSAILQTNPFFPSDISQVDPLYAPLPSPEEERAMYHFCREYMKEEGYQHYELSNFTKPGYQSRHNLVYWNAEPYWGFGAGAASYLGGRRYRQLCDFSVYLDFYSSHSRTVDLAVFEDMSDFNSCLEEQQAVSRKEAMREFFLLGLRLSEGVSSLAFFERFGEAIPSEILSSLSDLTVRGLLAEDVLDAEPSDLRISGTQTSNSEATQSRVWRLSLRGLDFGNEVFREFC